MRYNLPHPFSGAAPALTALLLALGAAGCDDDETTDAGALQDADVNSDAGSFDAGPEEDSGAQGRTCSPMGSECTISPGVPEGDCEPLGGEARTCVIQGDPPMAACVVVGPVAEGGACNPSITGECEAGTQCVGEPNDGVCRRVCCATMDCPDDQVCVEVEGAQPDGNRGGSCQPPVDCNPLNSAIDGSNDCPVGEACVVEDAALACVSPGPGADGDPCTAPADCGAGLGCFFQGSDGTCRQFCDPMLTPADCDPTEQCVDVEGFQDIIGYCVN